MRFCVTSIPTFTYIGPVAPMATSSTRYASSRTTRSLHPFAPRTKVYIIQDAHRLAGAPANALLKTLEEPPQNVVCILVANSESAVLETLRMPLRSTRP